MRVLALERREDVPLEIEGGAHDDTCLLYEEELDDAGTEVSRQDGKWRRRARLHRE